MKYFVTQLSLVHRFELQMIFNATSSDCKVVHLEKGIRMVDTCGYNFTSPTSLQSICYRY